jgi:hypothetical protein
MSTRSVLVVFSVGSLLAALPPAAHAQDGSRGLAEQMSGGGRSRGGVPKIVLVGLGLTTLSMLILLVVLAATRNQKQQSGCHSPAGTAPKAERKETSRGEGKTTPAPEPEPVEGVEWVKCPLCERFVADFLEMRQDALLCPSCSELLRPRPAG